MSTPKSRAHPNTLLNVHDLAEQMGVSVATIYRKRSTGEPFPRAVKFGRAVRWTQAEVDRWIDDHLEEVSR